MHLTICVHCILDLLCLLFLLCYGCAIVCSWCGHGVMIFSAGVLMLLLCCCSGVVVVFAVHSLLFVYVCVYVCM